LPGWFDPPVHFLSELRQLFGIAERPIGILTGRLLVARLAREHGESLGMHGQEAESGPARSHMLDALFGDLLAEGVDDEELRAAFLAIDSDDFTRRRNRWVADTYSSFRESLRTEGLFDARQIHALAAERVEQGGLAEAVRGAGSLHVYGITSLHQRHRLFRALAAQRHVDVTAYVVREPEASEWESLTSDILDLDDEQVVAPSVQPVPDAVREAKHVARCVKRLLVEEGRRPRDIAVVARSGREDTRRVFHALRDCGVPATARLRSALAEVPALRALLDLFRAQAEGWDYRGIRSVTMTPYFGRPLDPTVLDFLASQQRIRGLDAWRASADRVARLAREGADDRVARQLRSRGLDAKRIEATRERLAVLQDSVRHLAATRTEAEWIELTREITAGSGFGFRRHVCRVVGDRYDVVRLDQRAVTLVDSLLHEWRGLVRGRSKFGASEWYDRLRRLLEANELALTTPMQEGVQILEAHEAALTPFLHVFVVHANDGEFPRAAPGAGIFSDRERAALRQGGLPLEDRSLSLRRERALWRSVTAGPAVTVTYRTATVGGVPLLASLMVPEHDPTSALPRSLAGRTGGESISRAEQRREDTLRIARLRRSNDPSSAPVCDVDSVRQAVIAAFAEEVRSGRLDDVRGLEHELGLPPAPLLGRDWPISERAHAYAGWLRDPAVLEVLAERFGPEHVWSAGQLQQYSVRPFDFLLRRVLHIEDRAEAEEDTSPLAAGSVVHAVLESLHRSLLEAGPDTFARAEELLDEVCDEVFAEAEREAELWLGQPAIWNLKREHLRERIRGFVHWEKRTLGNRNVRPIAVEHVFGMDGSDPVRLTGTDVRGRPAELLLAGRIDRIDRLPGGTVRVVDYKSGQVPGRKGYEDGALLQSALYMRAWEQITGSVADQGLFLSVKDPGKGSKSGLPAAQVDDVLRYAFSIPARVRAGLFEPVQAHSTREIADWQPGREVTRSTRVLGAGTRFEHDPDGGVSGG
ncbi:MAG: PD-(D/E)XK nuclease family protein, partial [Gemmatimonadota bacterium]